MSARVRWRTGGEALVESIDAERVTLRSSAPAPPGARIEGTLEGDLASADRTLRVKVHACRRVEGDRFAIVGRPIDLSRSLRDALVIAISPADAAPAPDDPTRPPPS